jgi:hypothetical protein
VYLDRRELRIAQERCIHPRSPGPGGYCIQHRRFPHALVEWWVEVDITSSQGSSEEGRWRGVYEREIFYPLGMFLLPSVCLNEKSCSLRSLEVADDSSAGRMLIESSMRFLEHGTRIGQRNIHPSLQGNTWIWDWTLRTSSLHPWIFVIVPERIIVVVYAWCMTLYK